MPKTHPQSAKELVLVTGGAGFIGGHLVDALIAGGYNVRVLDTLASPTHNGKLPEWFNTKAELLKGDVRNKKDWVKALEGIGAVFHLASYMDFHLDFSTYIATNAESTALMYETIVEKSYPVKKIIIASSQSVYGEGTYRCGTHGLTRPFPRSEKALKEKKWEQACPVDGSPLTPVPQAETDPLLPIIPYGISKKTSEELAFCLGRLYAIPSVALRYTIVHGARQSFRHFYSGALRQIAVMALSGEDVVLHEDGEQLRDYVNVHDVVDAHMLALENPKMDFDAFNVGRGKPTRVRELAEIIAQEAGVPASFRTPGLYRVGAPRHSPSDSSKLQALGWKPRRSIADGVREYIEWIRQHLKAKTFLKETLRTMKNEKLLR